MYIRCYRCKHNQEQVREQIWALIYARGWMSDRIDQMYFWIPERYVSFALLIDSTLEAVPNEDYIADDDYRH